MPGLREEGHTSMLKENTPGEVQELRIYLLGGFRVMVGERAITEWRLRKAKSLVKMLALAPDHRYHREQLLDQLWPDLEPEAALNNLHRVVHTARSILEPQLASLRNSAYLHAQDDVLSLSPSLPVWIDVEQFELARSAIREAQEPALYQSALALYSGDLLPEDRYEDWTIRRREQLRQSYLALLSDLGRVYIARQEHHAAIETLQKLVAEEPTLEEAHLELIRYSLETGQRYQALRQYQQLRDALRRDLDAEPSIPAQRLYRDIQAGRIAQEQEQAHPAAPVLDGVQELSISHQDVEKDGQAQEQQEQADRPTNLPHALTSFVGRGDEMGEIRRLLTQTRLITLTGVGGSGKTRLAIHTAATLAEMYSDGVWLVELAALTDPSLVPQEVATALDVRETAARSLVEGLIEALRSKRILLLLDNCEHLVDACAELAETLLQACRHLRILATSRQALGVMGEVAWQTPSLAAPHPEHLPPFEHLPGYDAVRLFLERVATSRPGVALTPANASSVVQICHRLDGIPLALELAAVRVKALSVEQIAARLDNTLALLVTGNRAALPRQQTLQATIDWSFALLNEEEQTLFRRLSVFAGWWSLEAAEGICAGENVAAARVLGLLDQLVNKSLVVAEEHDGRMRYRLLEVLRQYGAEKLASAGETSLVRERHARWYLAMDEGGKARLEGPEQGEWMEVLEGAHDNLRVALRWALDKDDAEYGLRLGSAVWRFWQVRGYLSEGRKWFGALLAMHQGKMESLRMQRAQALLGAGVLAMDQGDFQYARGLYEESLALYRQLQEKAGITRALNNLGIVVENLGEFQQAVLLYEESLELARESGDQDVLARALNNLGVVTYHMGDYQRAEELYQESLAIMRALDNKLGVIVALNNVSEAACRQGDYQRAVVTYKEGLAQAQRLGFKTAIAFFLGGLAETAAGLRQTARSVRLWGASDTLRTEIGAPLEPADLERYQQAVTHIRAMLGEEAFGELWEAGRAMPLDQAVLYALSEEPSGAEMPSPAKSSALLSQREWQIAKLIAEGRTNREIADTLAIAQRTVDTHVGHMLSKLGFSSRAQISGWIVEEQQLRPA
ncbi:MAG TPA: tetratricopeptide repeat protein [Ktedonobacteraceae bacterium]|nr:tetratricopeptide repeat protein [Ktedonobacteraceae bacterium]